MMGWGRKSYLLNGKGGDLALKLAMKKILRYYKLLWLHWTQCNCKNIRKWFLDFLMTKSQDVFLAYSEKRKYQVSHFRNSMAASKLHWYPTFWCALSLPGGPPCSSCHLSSSSGRNVPSPPTLWFDFGSRAVAQTTFLLSCLPDKYMYRAGRVEVFPEDPECTSLLWLWVVPAALLVGADGRCFLSRDPAPCLGWKHLSCCCCCEVVATGTAQINRRLDSVAGAHIPPWHPLKGAPDFV